MWKGRVGRRQALVEEDAFRRLLGEDQVLLSFYRRKEAGKREMTARMGNDLIPAYNTQRVPH